MSDGVGEGNGGDWGNVHQQTQSVTHPSAISQFGIFQSVGRSEISPLKIGWCKIFRSGDGSDGRSADGTTDEQSESDDPGPLADHVSSI